MALNERRCPKCGSYCDGACFEEVPAVEVGNREGWFAVGNRGERIERIPAQCEDCGGLIEYNADADRYDCGGYVGLDGYDDMPAEDLAPCGARYSISTHVAYDCIYA